jgi:hypothetical protein
MPQILLYIPAWIETEDESEYCSDACPFLDHGDCNLFLSTRGTINLKANAYHGRYQRCVGCLVLSGESFGGGE